jgi:hypothetical protein
MALSITVPQVGQPFSTQAVIADNNFTNLAAWANGGIAGTDLSPSAAIADTQLASPNNAVRRVILSGSWIVPGATTAATYPIGPVGNAGVSAEIFTADTGISSQPTDFQVAGKTFYGRVRGNVSVNGTAPIVNVTLGLYLISAVGGGASAFTFTLGSAVGSSTILVAAPASGSSTDLESAQFAMPSTAGNRYLLGVNISGGSGVTTTNSAIHISAQLLGYHA